jgi:hypothetical protein
MNHKLKNVPLSCFLWRQYLELEVAELNAEIQIEVEKLGEMLDREKFSEELGSVAVWKFVTNT